MSALALGLCRDLSWTRSSVPPGRYATGGPCVMCGRTSPQRGCFDWSVQLVRAALRNGSANILDGKDCQDLDLMAPRPGLEPGTCGLTDCRRVAFSDTYVEIHSAIIANFPSARPLLPWLRSDLRNGFGGGSISCGTAVALVDPGRDATRYAPMTRSPFAFAATANATS